MVATVEVAAVEVATVVGSGGRSSYGGGRSGGGGYGRSSRDDRGTKRKDTDGDGKNSYGGRSRW